jgi:RimJ/RimL family protein N-acetyltransferase
MSVDRDTRIAYRPLSTARLRLRRPTPADAARIYGSLGADPEVTRYLTWRPHRELADAEAALASRIARLESGVEDSWIIAMQEGDEVVGLISAWFENDATELGFVLARARWGQGLMTEAVCAVRDWALGQGGVARVWATCDCENRASARVLEKAGFSREEGFVREIVRPNLSASPRPSLRFGLSADGPPDGRAVGR